MSFTLYDATIPGFIRTAESIANVLKKGREHYHQHALDLDGAVNERLCGDMLPLSFQVKSVRTHSIGAIEGIRAGTFSPIPPMSDPDYVGLEEIVANTISDLKAMDADEVNAMAGKDVVFSMKDVTIPFVAEDFLMSCSIPNFHFHATATYDILRMKGVTLGKRDYLGKLAIKQG